APVEPDVSQVVHGPEAQRGAVGPGGRHGEPGPVPTPGGAARRRQVEGAGYRKERPAAVVKGVLEPWPGLSDHLRQRLAAIVEGDGVVQLGALEVPLSVERDSSSLLDAEVGHGLPVLEGDQAAV